MKNILLMLFAGLTLASCSEISTDPAPARLTRTQNVSVTYSLTAPALAADTALVNPKLEVYLLNPATQSDGSVFYPLTSTGPLTTITSFTTAAQTVSVGNVVVSDGQPAPIVRLVFSSDNLPGRRAGAQRITTGLLVNSTTPRVTTTYSGLDFARRTATPPPAAPFRKQTDLSVAIY